MSEPPFRNLYYGPDGVLINKLGIHDAEELRKVEYEVTRLRTGQLEAHPIQGRYDFEHLAAIHKILFEPVYEWAGQARTINFSKVPEAHPSWKSVFADLNEIHPRMEAIAKGIEQANGLRGLTPKTFAHALADVYREVNYVHPFPEGNGRAQKIYLDQLAREAGYELRFDRISERDWDFAAANSWVMTHQEHPAMEMEPDISIVRRQFEKIVEPLPPDRAAPARALAFEQMPRDEALKVHPELRGSYALLDAISGATNERRELTQPARGAIDSQARDRLQKQLDAGVIHRLPLDQEQQRGPQPPEHSDPER
jgi:cell filamentation protein